jgi:hypothetical protein
MQNEFEPVANRDEAGFVQYVCQLCGGYRTLIGASTKFLPFIDHLIRDLALLENPKLREPRLVGDQIWYQLPESNETIWGLPAYDPDSAEWKRLLANRQKILRQAMFFLLDIADWLEKALSPLGGLACLGTSDLLTAEQVVKLVKTLTPEFQEQRDYLLHYEEKLKDTGMDPKWLTGPDRQADFIARSMAGARWDLSPSSSREMIRQMARNARGESLRKLKIQAERRWWEPEEEA